MEVAVLLGAAPPEMITADVIKNLRGPDGAKPCEKGLAVALKWIGDRSLPLCEAVASARKSRTVREYVDWALMALGYGYGDGSGSGSGFGYGYGSGSGYGDGYGSGSGYGDGDGDGYGSGSGYGCLNVRAPAGR